MRTAWAAVTCILSVSVAAAVGADGLRVSADLEASLSDHVGAGWAGGIPDGGEIDGLAFALESDGSGIDGLATDGAYATGGGVATTFGGDGAADGDRATVAPLPSGAALAFTGLACVGLRRTRRRM